MEFSVNETRILSLILQTPRALPPLIWGDFGIGKTSRILDLCNQLGWEHELLRPAERGEGALGVVPVPSEDRKVLHYPLPDWAARMRDSEKPGLLFIDEISSCPPALQPSIMGLALDGIIAGQQLPERIRRIAAGNPVDQAAGGWDLAPALANRFIHLNWDCPKADEWTAWLSGQGASNDIVRLDLDAWDKQWGQAKALGCAFIKSHPSALHEDVYKVIGRTPQAYTTPRSWECALRLLASCRASGSMDLYASLAQGTLGPAVALEGKGAWLVWLRDNDLPDPEALLADPDKFEHDAKRPDRTFATLLAVAEAGLATINGKKFTDKDRGERWERAYQVIEKAHASKIGKDIILLPSRMMADKDRRPECAREICKKNTAARRINTLLLEFIDLVEMPEKVR
jgi:hypothetical protein